MKSSCIQWAAALCVAAKALSAQAADVLRLHELVEGVTVTPRVLLINARPEDEDNRLIAWLSRGRHVETGVLSLTRGESGTNFLGVETGTVLGVVRTEEMLAARQIDGAEQFFTHGYDFGFARNAAEVWTHWKRDSIVGDVVSIIRAFRPHVVIVSLAEQDPEQDGQRAALAHVVSDAVNMAADRQPFLPAAFGYPWRIAKLYQYGGGLSVRTNEFDHVLGKTYDAIALEARAQYRSQGLLHLALPATPIQLERVAPRADAGSAERSIFDGIDTTVARLVAGAPADVAPALPAIVATADSARRALDLARPSSAAGSLASLVKLLAHARAAASWCAHPGLSSAPPAIVNGPCDQATLDLDASLDLMRQRATDALLIAAGVHVTAVADRELVAESDTAVVTVTIENHGASPVTLKDLAVWGSTNPVAVSLTIPPDTVAHVTGTIAQLAEPHPWWIQSRDDDRFPSKIPSPVDGLARGELLPPHFDVRSGAVPENIRRTSDVSVTLDVGGAPVITSLGPVRHPYSDAVVGLQMRPIAGSPDVTLTFGRGLEWVVERKPITRDVYVMMASTSDKPVAFAPNIARIPHGMRVDSLPKTIRLAPHEQRELILHLRGRTDSTYREALAVTGEAPPRRFASGYRTYEYPELTPIHVARASGAWIQPVSVEVPAALSVIYVRGVADDIPTALKQIGITTIVIAPDELLAYDISKVSTVVIGPRAAEGRPDIAAQSGRLFDFVRAGGTLIVERGESPTLRSRLMPSLVSMMRPRPERIMSPEAPVVVEEPNVRVLNWPNKIGTPDWNNWVSARAPLVPSTAGGYSKPLEIHDRDQLENRNALLVRTMGKGTFIYTALTFDEQIAGGVPGALRLFVNLLSASLPLSR